MQKLNINFAKHRTKGFILDFFVKALEIEQKDSDYQKTYQRFIKEEGISSEEYNDTLNTVLSDILHHFDLSQDEKIFIFSYAIELCNIYNAYVLNNETLATSQKQLDFLSIITFLIPLCSSLINDKTLLSLIATKELNSIQLLFKLIEQSLVNNEDFGTILFEYLDNKKATSYDTIKKNINKWIHDKVIPDIRHIDMITEAFHTKTALSKKQLNNYCKAAKVFQYFHDKSIEYFGEKLTNLLIFHFKYLNNFSHEFSNINMQREMFENRIKKIFPGKNEGVLFKYFDIFFYSNFDLKIFILNNVLKPDNYDFKVKQEIQKIVKSNAKYIEIMYKVKESSFFNKIDMILPFYYFNGNLDYEELQDIDEDDIDTEFYYYSNELSKLYLLTLPSKEKKNQDDEEYQQLRQQLKLKYELQENPYYNFLEARYYAQKKEYKHSTDFYLKALAFGKNCMSSHIKDIIIEGLVVSAQDTRNSRVNLINAKSSFTKFYKEAYHLKIIDSLPKELNQHFLNDMKKQFNIYFKNLYSQEKNNSPHITPNLSISDNSQKPIIDFFNPNKLIKKNTPNPITQLIYCASEHNYKAVAELIKRGANANILKESENASALLLTFPEDIMRFNILKNDKKRFISSLNIMKLLIPKMTKEALNTKLIKQQESALSYAVEYGLVDIVELLIKYGINLQAKATLDEQTALYLAIQCISRAKKISNDKFIKENPLESKKEMKKLVKANKYLRGISDIDRENEYHSLIKVKGIQNKPDMWLEYTNDLYRNSLDEYYQIFDLLIKHMSKVDIASKRNITPLIFATELNEEDLVKKLLGKGANIDWYNDDGHRAYDYAEVNNNDMLMELLD